jgi:hypothetical protein
MYDYFALLDVKHANNVDYFLLTSSPITVIIIRQCHEKYASIIWIAYSMFAAYVNSSEFRGRESMSIFPDQQYIILLSAAAYKSYNTVRI